MNKDDQNALSVKIHLIRTVEHKAYSPDKSQ
jgi:hypothetical protein